MQVAICWACVLKSSPSTAQSWASRSTCAGATAGILIRKTALHQVPARTAALIGRACVQHALARQQRLSKVNGKVNGEASESTAGPLTALWQKQAGVLRPIAFVAALCHIIEVVELTVLAATSNLSCLGDILSVVFGAQQIAVLDAIGIGLLLRMPGQCSHWLPGRSHACS